MKKQIEEHALFSPPPELIDSERYAVPEGVEIIQDYAFNDWKRLRSLFIPASVAEIEDDAFPACYSLTSFEVAEDNPRYRSIDGVLFAKDGKTLVRYPEGKERERYVVPEGVEIIEANAFYGAASLGSVVLPKSVAKIKEFAFFDCSSLKAFDVAEDNARYRSIDGVLFTGDGKKLLAYPRRKKATDYAVPEGVVEIERDAFRDCSSLKTVVLSESVAAIGNRAFSDCYSLESVVFSKKLKRVGFAAFWFCSSLKSVVFPEGVRTIDQEAFGYCSSLESVVVPESVKSIGYNAFTSCSSLKSFDVAKGNPRYRSIDGVLYADKGKTLLVCPKALPGEVCVVPQGVKEIASEAFWDCRSVKSIVLPKSLKRIKNDAFWGCSSLESIDVPDGVKEIGSFAFRGCEALASIRLPKKLKTVQDSVFEGCSSLTRVDVPEGVDKIERQAFLNCSALESVVIPESVGEIGDSAFVNCSALKTIDLPKSLRKLGKDAFLGCSSLTSLDVGNNRPNCRSIDGVLFSEDGKTLLEYPSGADRENYAVPQGVEIINDDAFRENTTLKSVELPQNLVEIKSGAFSECSALTSVVVPEGTKLVGFHAFADCVSLKSFVVPQSVEEIGSDAFSGCAALTSIDVAKENPNYRTIDGVLFSKDGKTLVVYPSGKETARYVVPKEVETIEKCAFGVCKALTSIDVEKGSESFRSIDGILLSADGKKLVLYPSGRASDVCVVPDGVETIETWAFANCSSVKSIVLPESVRKLESGALINCASLQSIVLSKGLSIIERWAFGGCSSLTSIVVPEGVVEIEDCAFSRCSALRSVVLPKSVKEIGYGAFDPNEALTITAPQGSRGEEYARKNKIRFEPIERATTRRP
ncbi:MAG: leucine-rich repeat protein [Thermoguttaceae bacterium]|nr:leucine-rich repeat protein [Thermoguttaceae bacterium]